MTASRSRKEERHYAQHQRTVNKNVCAFCHIEKGDAQFIEETPHFKVIKNFFPYSLWDGQDVADHLMVVPKRHTDSLARMNNKEKIEYVNILEKYESHGYNIYSRAPSSSIKSVIHQHTHFIKPGIDRKKFVLMNLKPFFRITW